MESKFNNLFKLIMQELTKSQKQLVDKYVNKQQTGLKFGPVFAKLRTYFPLENKVAKNIEPSASIKSFLDEAGFYITDYRAGIAMKKSKPGEPKDLRKVKIGKIFQKLGNQNALKQFNERLGTSKKNIIQINFQLCITHDPYDIAGMSTDRNWTSCMNLDAGCYKDTPLKQVQYGGMCAYLINAEDKEIKEPYARIAIKRLVGQSNIYNNFIFVSENTIYGDEDLAKELHMQQMLIEILQKSNEQTIGDDYHFIRDDEESYSDSNINEIYKFDKENKIIDQQSLSSLIYMIREFILNEDQINFIINKFNLDDLDNYNDQFWQAVSGHVELSIEFLRKYKDFICWGAICKFYCKLTCYYADMFSKHIEYLVQFKDYVKWENICRNVYLKDQFLIKYKNLIQRNTLHVLNERHVSNYLLHEFEQYFDKQAWKSISSFDNLHEQNIREFSDKVNWQILCKREVEYSTKFLKEFQDKIDWKYMWIYGQLTNEQMYEFEKFNPHAGIKIKNLFADN